MGSIRTEGNFTIGSTVSVWVLPDQAWWRNIWIINPTYVGAVFTALTVLTCYQIASSVRRCVRLQWWAEKRPFTRLRALDNGVVGQLFFVIFRPFVEDVTSISMLTSPIPSALNLTLCHLNPMYSLTFYRMSLLSSPTHCSSRMVNLPLRATLSEPRWCGHQYKIPYFLVTELTRHGMLAGVWAALH